MCEHLMTELREAFANWSAVTNNEYKDGHNIRRVKGNGEQLVADTPVILTPTTWTKLAYIAERALCETCAEAQGRTARQALIDFDEMMRDLWYRRSGAASFMRDVEDGLYDGKPESYERDGRRGPKIARFPRRETLIAACPPVEPKPRKRNRNRIAEAIRAENAELRAELAELRIMLGKIAGQQEMPF